MPTHTRSNILQDCVLVSMGRYEVFYSSPDVLFYVAHTSWPTETTRRGKAKSLTVSEWGCCPCAVPNAPSRRTYLDPRHGGGNIARYLWQKPKLAIKDVFQTPLETPAAKHVCLESFSVRRGALNNISLCFVINGNIHADYRATTGVRDVVCLAALQRVGWYEESDKRSIKRPIFSHVCQAGQGCCLFVGEVTRLLQCGHSNTKQSRLCPRVFGKDLLSFLVSQFVQAQVVPTGWPPCNRKHMKSILTSQTPPLYTSL